MADVLISEPDGLRSVVTGNLYQRAAGGSATDPGTGYHDVSTVSANGDDGNVPGNVLDGNYDTRWSHDADPSQLTIDLGATVTVGGVEIAWFKGDQRSTTFEVYASADAASWTLVYAGVSSGTTAAFEVYDFVDIDARYVRIDGYGNDSATSAPWTSITELRVPVGNGTGSAWPSAPSSPPTLTAGSPSATSVQLTASEVSGATGYKFYRDGTLIADTSSTSVTASGLSPETTYSFTALAYNSVGDGPLSTAASVTTVASTSAEDPAPTDLGTDIREYIKQPGGQTIVIPNGNYTAGELANASHSDWLILKAETPGQVVVTGMLKMQGCSRVVFAGIKFTKEFQLWSGGSWDNGNDRILSWYCDHSQPQATASPGVENGVHFTGGNTRVAAVGADIHDCWHDGIKMKASGSVAQGCRIWNIYDTANDSGSGKHNDTLQIETGFDIEFLDNVVGVDPQGNTSEDGHIQIGAEPTGNGITARLERLWAARSGSHGIMVGGKDHPNGCHVDMVDVHIWEWGGGTESNGFQAYAVSGGATVTTTRVTSGGPPAAGSTPPDVAWRAANPYESYMDWLTARAWA